jgi:uncharacterized protein YdeI (YjbR/CyaY-like superfamily)
MEPVYFTSAESLRRWFEENHSREKELIVGYYKKDTKQETISWSESVDEALCYGWIDGIRRSIDAERYCIRFTPRNPGSNWSAVNLKKVDALIRAGRMRDAGMQVYELRKPEKEQVYSYENGDQHVLTGEMEQRFRQQTDAWRYYTAQTASYRKTTARWVMSARQEVTRSKRLEELIASCADGEYIKAMRWANKGGSR